MSQESRRLAPPPTAASAYYLADSYVRFVEDLWTRYWNVGASSLRRLLRIVEQGSIRPFDAERLFRAMAGEYANYVYGLAASAPAASELAAATMSGPARAWDEGGPSAGGAVPRTRGSLAELPAVAGEAPRPLALPSRIIDASQGWALYLVSAEIAAAVLGDPAEIVPFDAGGGRTFLAVLSMDHRVSDLGCYQEIALALSVTPRNHPSRPPGAMFVGVGVSGEFSRDAGRAVWGIEKVYNRDLAVSYAPRFARFGMLHAPGALVASYPRFGNWRSANMPLLIYSRRAGADGEMAPALASLMSLSGRGEGFQIGGSVSIRLGSGNPGACVCQGLGESCLCATLERFGVADRLPAANGWTEHLAVTLGAPMAL